MPSGWLPNTLIALMLAGSALAQTETGIPVTNRLVIEKCGVCHTPDARGNLQRISWMRTTPEGWQDALKQMILTQGLSVTPAEARAIVRYLSDRHGLAPAEAKPVLYDAERRVRETTAGDGVPGDGPVDACAKCHNLARALSWRRSPEEWKRFVDAHAGRYRIRRSQQSAPYLATTAPLHSPDWENWSARMGAADFAGRWIVSASWPGHGKYFGEITLEKRGDDFATRATLTSLRDGSRLTRTGLIAVFGDSAWRGRSSGELFPDAREVLLIAADHAHATGRWFWGQYQEFGLDVELYRPGSEPAILMLDRTSLRAGSSATRMRILGVNLPAKPGATDFQFGPGIAVKSVVSANSGEIVLDVDAATNAAPGLRDVAFRNSVLARALAVYDRVDYLKVTPESAMAAFSDGAHPAGYQQFEAIAYQRGPDGKAHTEDDLELGPIGADWSVEVFHDPPDRSSAYVGAVSTEGLFTPASINPGNNFDVWVTAVAKNEKDAAGKPLTGKSYLVVTVPTYTLNGRKYVREQDRWVDDGPAPN